MPGPADQFLAVLGRQLGVVGDLGVGCVDQLVEGRGGELACRGRMTSLRSVARSPVTDCPSASSLRARRAAKTTALFEGHRR
jgi:hypothetical protein